MTPSLRKAAFVALCLAAGAGPGWAQSGDAARDCPPPPPAPLREDSVTPRDRGALWKLSRDGRDSWLYATLHLGRPEWLFPGPTLREALKASDLVAVEIDITAPETAQALAQATAALPRPELPAPLQRRLKALADRACLPTLAQDQLARAHPGMQLLALTMIEGQWEGLSPLYAQELALTLHARRHNRSVVSLETVADQLASLLPRDDAALRPQLEQSLHMLERDQMRPMLRRLTAAWERGDLADIANHAEWCQCVPDDDARRALARLNDDRNPGLARAIDALHRRDLQVFAAVGVLHMTGPQALPALLQGLGYRVERVPLAR